jgi:hypothetical protein
MTFAMNCEVLSGIGVPPLTACAGEVATIPTAMVVAARNAALAAADAERLTTNVLNAERINE